MKYRKLEGTDLTVPQYVLGTGDYASNVPPETFLKRMSIAVGLCWIPLIIMGAFSLVGDL